MVRAAEAQRGDFSGFPWELNLNGPEYGWSGSNISPGLRLDLALNPRSSVHVSARYTRIDGDIDGQALLAVSADGRSVRRFQYHEDSEWHEYQSDTFATLTLEAGRVEHRLVELDRQREVIDGDGVSEPLRDVVEDHPGHGRLTLSR